MGRVSQAQAEENRRRVVDTASRLFREQGTHVSVADLMKAAGLTHGAFYKQFASRRRSSTRPPPTPSMSSPGAMRPGSSGTTVGGMPLSGP